MGERNVSSFQLLSLKRLVLARRREWFRKAPQVAARLVEVDGLLAFSQKSGEVWKLAPSFRAISAVTDVRPLTMRFTTFTSQPR